MDRTVFNKAQLEMLDIMAGIRSEEELEELKFLSPCLAGISRGEI